MNPAMRAILILVALFSLAFLLGRGLEQLGVEFYEPQHGDTIYIETPP